MPLFDSEFLKKIEYLSIVSRRVFRGQLIAQRRTMQLGSGVEFADHRDYVPGDDFRYLDWNLYARHDELLLKRFQEEEDLHLYLMLDCSRSMSAGNPSKFDLARQVTAAMAYIALADLDRVAILAFADGILQEFPLTRGKNRILTLLQFLERLEPTGTDTNLRDMVMAFVHRQQRNGLTMVVSDLFDPSGYQNGLDRLRHHKYEPHVIQIYDKSEAEPSMLGDVELIDIETEATNKITVTEKHLKSYRRVFGEFMEGARDYSRKYGVGYTVTTADVPFEELILGMMRRAGMVG